MKLTKITIKNYKSMDQLELVFNGTGGNSGLFGFLGLNESGKSNLLKAISMKDYLSEFKYDDFITHEKEGEPVEIIKTSPSFAVKVGMSQFAFDSEIASNIFVRLYDI